MSRRSCLSTIWPGTCSRAAVSVTSRVIASALSPRAVNAATQSFAFVPRAAATTVAPCSASRVAIARPMPRDAPVTSATLPVRLNMEFRFDRCEIVRLFDVEDCRLAVDPLHHAAQRVPGTHFNIRCDALRRKALHDRFPPHRRRDLLDERL